LPHGGSTLPLLAQLDILQPPPTLPSLPDPPVLQHALLENPIPPVILAVALGLAAYAVAARFNRRRAGLMGAAIGLALGGAVLALSVLVRTDRERVQARTRELVAAVATADTVALDTILADDARLYPKGATMGRDKDEIIAWVERYLAPGGLYAVESHSVREVQAEIRPNGKTARTRATVVITPTDGSPTRFLCMLAWEESSPGEWRLIEIDPLWLQGWGEISEAAMRTTPRW